MYIIKPHAEMRMRQRNITKEQVDTCIQHGTQQLSGGRTRYIHGPLTVVLQRRTRNVVTVLTSDVQLMPCPRELSREHHERLSTDLGVHAWYDHEACQYELYGSPRKVQMAMRYIENI